MQGMITPTLSVIIPVYNAEQHLSSCIDSILGQTFKNFELILVNDGSTDSSLSICYEYAQKDNRVVIVDKQNEGAGPARNRGIEQARGEYLAFPDSDDWLDTNAYEVSLRTIESENVDLVIFGMKIHKFDDENNKDIEIVEKIPNSYFFYSRQKCRENYSMLFSNVNMNSPCNKIYKAKLINKYNLRFPNMRRMQDCVFNIYYYDHIQAVSVIPHSFYNCRWHLDAIEKKKLPRDYVDLAVKVHQTQILTVAGWNDIVVDTTPFDGMLASTIESAILVFSPNEEGFWYCYDYIKGIIDKDYIHNFYVRYLNKQNNIRKIQLAIKYRLCLLLTVYRLYTGRRK